MTSNVTLPVISLADDTAENARRTLAAGTEYGFLYVDTLSTGIAPAAVERMFALAERFFAQPTASKAAYTITTANRGWTGVRNETLDPAHQRRGDLKEAFNFGELEPAAQAQALPPAFAERAARDDVHAFAEACRATVNGVLDLLGRALDIDGGADFFSRRHTQPSGATLRLLHYPAVARTSVDDEEDIRAGAHSDYGSCTLLFQRVGQPGLEIRTPAGTWAPVPVIPAGYAHAAAGVPPILVNFGDLLSYWTNGLLKSTVHRVVFPGGGGGGGGDGSEGGADGANKDRYSIAYFAHPGNDVELVAVPSRLVQEHEHSFRQSQQQVGYGGGVGDKALTAREHLNKRLQATYGFRDEVK